MRKSPSTGRRALAFVLAALALVGQDAFSQEPTVPDFESRFVEANGVRLQYMDFGGSGLPLIFVQDVHNFFEYENPYFRDLLSAFYARFTDRHRVLATVRRGYGESDAPGWGYDVPSQSEDLLSLMDALGIRRAVLFGNTTATQDMTWIAEHHPERLVGLVYEGNPPVFDVFGSPANPDAQRFSDLYNLASCDLQERADELLKPRSSWRPHFLADSSARIDVAALRFTNPAYDRKSMSVRRVERLEAALDEIDTWQAECPGEEPYLAFVDSLASDPGRLAALREAFEASDNTIPIDDAMVRAFGVNMETVRWGADDLDGWPNFMFPHMRRFLQSLPSLEANGKPATLD